MTKIIITALYDMPNIETIWAASFFPIYSKNLHGCTDTCHVPHASGRQRLAKPCQVQLPP